MDRLTHLFCYSDCAPKTIEVKPCLSHREMGFPITIEVKPCLSHREMGFPITIEV